MRWRRACCSASTSSISFLAAMAVRNSDSNTGSSDWASSRVNVRSDMGCTSIFYRTAQNPGLTQLYCFRREVHLSLIGNHTTEGAPTLAQKNAKGWGTAIFLLFMPKGELPGQNRNLLYPHLMPHDDLDVAG